MLGRRVLALALSSAVLVAVASGCAQSSGVVPTTVSAQSVPAAARPQAGRVQRHRTKFTVAIRIPPRRHKRSAHFVSPSTQSIAIRIYDATHTTLLATAGANLTPYSPGCTRGGGGAFQCALSVLAPIGQDTFDITTYDALYEVGNPLSAVSAYPFTVGNGGALAVTLDAIPASVQLSKEPDVFFRGDQISGFQIAGLPSEFLDVFAFDADGNLILGPGAPSLSLHADSTSLAIAQDQYRPNRFMLTPMAFQKTPIALTATATSGYGTVTNATAALQLVPLLFAGNFGDGSVGEYVPWGPTPVVTVGAPSGLSSIYGMCTDAHGNVYVAYFGGNAVVEYAPGSTTPARTIKTGINAPEYGLAVDSNGNLFVNNLGNQTVTEYAPGATSPSATLTGFSAAYGLATDAAGDLFVADEGNGSVDEFAPGATTPTATLTNGLTAPWQLTLDGQGNLYVADYNANAVVKYAPPFTNASMPAKVFSAGIARPSYVAVDASQNLYVANFGTTTNVTEYDSSGNLLRTLTSSIDFPYWLALDGSDTLYVASYGKGTVPVFASGTATSPVKTYAAGLSNPIAVAIWP